MYLKKDIFQVFHTLINMRVDKYASFMQMYVYIKQQSKTMTNTVQEIYPFCYCYRELVACGVIHAPPCKLPNAVCLWRGEGGLSASAVCLASKWSLKLDAVRW